MSGRVMGWWLFGIAAVALLSAASTLSLAALAAGELLFLVRDSREADATITEMRSAAVGPSWPPHAQRDVWQTEYVFTDSDGTQRMGFDRLETDFPARRGQTVRVRYLAGPTGRSMIVGRYDGYAVWALAVSAGVFALSSVVVVRSVLRRLRVQPVQEFDPCVR
jgi:hypothetical protein